MRASRQTAVGTGLVVIALSCAAFGQARPAGPTTGPATRPATQPAAAGALAVTVKSVTGVAQRRLPGEQEQWADLKSGDVLDELTVIRTGFASQVVLAFADNSQVTIDRATKMGIAEFRKQGTVTRTALGLKYGSMKASVEKAKGPNDFTVTTPVATLAVTGSGAQFAMTGDFGLGVRSHSGSWAVHMGAFLRHVEGTEGTDNNLTPWVDLAKHQSNVDLGDVSGGLTQQELSSLTYLGTGRGGMGFIPGGTGTTQTLGPLPSEIPEVPVPGLDDGIGK